MRSVTRASSSCTFVHLLQRFPYIPHTDTFLSIGSSEHSRVHGIKHDRVEGAFVLCQSFHSVVATYIVNKHSPVVAGAGKDFVIVRMNGQPVDGLLVQEDVERLAPATLKRRRVWSLRSKFCGYKSSTRLSKGMPYVRKSWTMTWSSFPAENILVLLLS